MYFAQQFVPIRGHPHSRHADVTGYRLADRECPRAARRAPRRCPSGGGNARATVGAAILPDLKASFHRRRHRLLHRRYASAPALPDRRRGQTAGEPSCDEPVKMKKTGHCYLIDVYDCGSYELACSWIRIGEATAEGLESPDQSRNGARDIRDDPCLLRTCQHVPRARAAEMK